MRNRIEFVIDARWGLYHYEAMKEHNWTYPKHWCVDVRGGVLSYPMRAKLPLADIEDRARELFNPKQSYD